MPAATARTRLNVQHLHNPSRVQLAPILHATCGRVWGHPVTAALGGVLDAQPVASGRIGSERWRTAELLRRLQRPKSNLEAGRPSVGAGLVLSGASIPYPQVVPSSLIDAIRIHLGETYAWFIGQGCEINLNGAAVVPIVFDTWAYPPNYRPRRANFPIEPTNIGKIDVVPHLYVWIRSSVKPSACSSTRSIAAFWRSGGYAQ
jgi:hypothetical protein